MTKYYLRLILLFGSVVAFFALVGSLLPRSYSFESEITISATPDAIFPRLNSLPKWQEWSRQWNPAEIENLVINYGDPTAGKGAAQTWQDIRGQGKLWITQSEPNQSLTYEMEFANFPKMTCQFKLQPQGKETIMRWSSQGKLPGGPFYGYFGWFFSTQMKSEYDRSLTKLKEVVENELTPQTTTDGLKSQTNAEN